MRVEKLVASDIYEFVNHDSGFDTIIGGVHVVKEHRVWGSEGACMKGPTAIAAACWLVLCAWIKWTQIKKFPISNETKSLISKTQNRNETNKLKIPNLQNPISKESKSLIFKHFNRLKPLI